MIQKAESTFWWHSLFGKPKNNKIQHFLPSLPYSYLFYLNTSSCNELITLEQYSKPNFGFAKTKLR